MNIEQIINFEQQIKEIEIDLLLSARISKIIDEETLIEYYVILDNIIKALGENTVIDRLLAGKLGKIYFRLEGEAEHARNFPRIKEIEKEFRVYMLKIFNKNIVSGIQDILNLQNKIDSLSSNIINSVKKDTFIKETDKADIFSILDETVRYFSLTSTVDRAVVGKIYELYFEIGNYVNIENYKDPLLLFLARLGGDYIDKLISNEVTFGRDIDAYNHFSNYSNFGFMLKNKYWKTVEHYYQAMKFENTKYEEEIRLLPTPEEAEKRGKDKRLPLRADWKSIKDRVMKEAVFAKFQSDDKLKELLLSTRYEDIAYYGLEDIYWGAGRNANGKNVLGRIVMETRRVLRSKQKEG